MEIDDRKRRAFAIRSISATEGMQEVIKHIDEEIQEGWEKFINLPVDKKTSKMAYNCQARYSVLKDLKEWIIDQVKYANNANG